MNRGLVSALALVGALGIGGALGWALRGVGYALNKAIAATYRCDQLRFEANARATAQALLEAELVGMSRDALAARFEESGVDVQWFDKGDHEVALIGVALNPDRPVAHTISITLVTGRVSEISEIPGATPCRPSENAP